MRIINLLVFIADTKQDDSCLRLLALLEGAAGCLSADCSRCRCLFVPKSLSLEPKRPSEPCAKEHKGDGDVAEEQGIPIGGHEQGSTLAEKGQEEILRGSLRGGKEMNGEEDVRPIGDAQYGKEVVQDGLERGRGRGAEVSTECIEHQS